MPKQRILLVDDEPDLLMALSVRLKSCGYTCDTATNGREGLEKVQAKRPDIILADLLMPEMDGYEMCRRLKSDPKTCEIPVIVLTAVPERALAHKPNEFGADRLLHKPFDSNMLVDIVKEMLGNGEEAGGER